MTASAAPQLLADKVGPGGTAALVVLLLIIASVGIFVALIGSLRRLRGNVSKGTFNHDGTSKSDGADSSDGSAPGGPGEPVTRDPGGRAGGGA